MYGLYKKTLSALATAGFAAVAVSSSTADVRAADARRLALYHTHTGEELDIVYFRNGEYDDSALAEINRFLADFRTGDVTDIDPELLDLLFAVRGELGGRGTYEVISAYRSPKTNEMLRGKSGGVARNSHHLSGRAIDVRLRGVAIEDLRDAALAAGRGGVGFYKRSNFVHMDTGRVRRW